jgi:hypothetical protein
MAFGDDSLVKTKLFNYFCKKRKGKAFTHLENFTYIQNATSLGSDKKCSNVCKANIVKKTAVFFCDNFGPVLLCSTHPPPAPNLFYLCWERGVYNICHDITVPDHG